MGRKDVKILPWLNEERFVPWVFLSVRSAGARVWFAKAAQQTF